MPRGVKKENLPTKICVICNRSFNWRKKWEKDWDQITACSNRLEFVYACYIITVYIIDIDFQL